MGSTGPACQPNVSAVLRNEQQAEYGVVRYMDEEVDDERGFLAEQPSKLLRNAKILR